jgi:hypothetical protein
MITAVVILIGVIAIAAYLTYTFHKNEDQPTIETFTEYTKEELENIKLAEELYNKDLRPVVAKKVKAKPAPELKVVEAEFVPKEVKPEFPIDKPKKKRKYYPRKKKQ